MKMPELQEALVELISAMAVDTGQDIVSVTEAELALPMEMGFAEGETGLIAGARPATTQMRTGFEAPLSAMRFGVVRLDQGGAP